MRTLIISLLLGAFIFAGTPSHPVSSITANEPAVPQQSSYGLNPKVLQPKETAEPSFRRALIKAAREAAAKGKISRRDAIRVRVASFSPAFLEQAEELCVVQMVFSGENSEDIPRDASGDVDRTAIDWDGFAAFLERIIPLIIEMLLAFGLGGA